MIDIRAQLDLMPPAPLRRRKRYVYESLKTRGVRLRFLKIAASHHCGRKLIRKIAVRQCVGAESACREAGLQAPSIGAKDLVPQREEISALFQLWRGPKGRDAG